MEEKKLSKQFCSECGNEITEPSKFCTSCGHTLGEQATPIQQVNTETPVQQAPPTSPTGQAPQGKRSNKNKLFAIIAGIIIIGVLVFFWQKDAPEDVAEEFFEHIMNFDFKKAEKLISSDADSSVREEFGEMEEGLDDLPFDLSGQMKLDHEFKVLNVEKNGKKATVHAKVSLLDFGLDEESYFELRKEKGKWKVSYIE